jgi:serine/threonine-protein kinase HipA
MVLVNATEEMALLLKGKTSNFNRELFFSYFSEERLELNKKVLSNIEKKIVSAIPKWFNLFEISFLSNEKKQEFLNIMNHRKQEIGWE